MLNRYDPAMGTFTKTTKIPLTRLRKKGHVSVVYLGDSYLQGNTYKQCLKNISNSINILQELGFSIHPFKSGLTPKQKIRFLKFEIDSCTMTTILTKDKFTGIYWLLKHPIFNSPPPPFSQTQSVRPYLVPFLSLCSTYLTYGMPCHSIGHQALPTQPLPGEAEDFHRGGKHPKDVLLSIYLDYFQPV